MCDVASGFQWEFVPEPGSYELYVDRINSGDDQDFDRRITVDKFDTFNALKEDPEFLEKMNIPSFADAIYKITSVGSGNLGVNINEIVWSPDDSYFIQAA